MFLTRFVLRPWRQINYMCMKKWTKNILTLILEGRQWQVEQQQALFLLIWHTVNIFLRAILVIAPAELT